jgi:hypothetical protein
MSRKLEELEAEPTDGSAKVSSCVSISGFDVCMGKTYSFLINGRQIIGTVDDVDPLARRVTVKTGRGRAVIVLKKISVIEEIT